MVHQMAKTNVLEQLFAGRNVKVYDNADDSKWQRVPNTVVKFSQGLLDEIVSAVCYECNSQFSEDKILKLLVETLEFKAWIPIDRKYIKTRGLKHKTQVAPESVYIYDITDGEHTTTVCIARAL